MKILYILIALILTCMSCKKGSNTSGKDNSINSNYDTDNFFVINNIKYYREKVNYLGGKMPISCSNNQNLWLNMAENPGHTTSLAILNSVGVETIILIDVVINNEKKSYISSKKPPLKSQVLNGNTFFEFHNFKFYENNTIDTSGIIYASGKLTCK